jgi:hypothetical protein
MGNTTNSQGLRYPYVDEGINSTNIQNLATDCATALDAQDVKRTLIIKRPVAAVFRSANQSIPVNTDTTIIWDTVSFDPNSMVNLGTQPTRITIPSTATGLWRVSISGALFGTAWTRTIWSVMVTGVVKGQKSFWQSDNSWSVFSTMVNVPNAGDYLEARIRHVGGGTDPINFLRMNAQLVAKT